MLWYYCHEVKRVRLGLIVRKFEERSYLVQDYTVKHTIKTRIVRGDQIITCREEQC